MFSLTASRNSLVSRDMSSSVSFPIAPKSTSPIPSPSGITSTFAGCGSPWKKPWRNTIVIHASATTSASWPRSAIVIESGSMSASWMPSSRSSVSTLPRV